MLGMVRSISGRSVAGVSGLSLQLCAGAAFVMWPDRAWIAQAVFALGFLLFISSVCLWFFANYRLRWPAVARAINDERLDEADCKTPTGSINDGLYVGEIRLTFDDLKDGRHSLLMMRVFNGTGSVVEFSSLGGQVKFNAINNTDLNRIGNLPTPSLRYDTTKTVSPLQEWFLILSQQVPASEANKLVAMLDEDITIKFDLSELTIYVVGEHDRSKVERLPIWKGVSYSRGNGFIRIAYGVANIKL